MPEAVKEVAQEHLDDKSVEKQLPLKDLKSADTTPSDTQPAKDPKTLKEEMVGEVTEPIVDAKPTPEQPKNEENPEGNGTSESHNAADQAVKEPQDVSKDVKESGANSVGNTAEGNLTETTKSPNTEAGQAKEGCMETDAEDREAKPMDSTEATKKDEVDRAGVKESALNTNANEPIENKIIPELDKKPEPKTISDVAMETKSDSATKEESCATQDVEMETNGETTDQTSVETTNKPSDENKSEIQKDPTEAMDQEEQMDLDNGAEVCKKESDDSVIAPSIDSSNSKETTQTEVAVMEMDSETTKPNEESTILSSDNAEPKKSSDENSAAVESNSIKEDNCEIKETVEEQASNSDPSSTNAVEAIGTKSEDKTISESSPANEVEAVAVNSEVKTISESSPVNEVETVAVNSEDKPISEPEPSPAKVVETTEAKSENKSISESSPAIEVETIAVNSEDKSITESVKVETIVVNSEDKPISEPSSVKVVETTEAKSDVKSISESSPPNEVETIGVNSKDKSISEPGPVSAVEAIATKVEEEEKKKEEEPKGNEKFSKKTSNYLQVLMENAKRRKGQIANKETIESSNEEQNEKTGEAGASSSAKVDPSKAEEIKKLVHKARSALTDYDYFKAADLFGQACEIAGNLYGDLAFENAELYYMYGCAMLECAKNEGTVLGEAVKEEDMDEEDLEGGEEEAGEEVNGGDEEMEVENENEATSEETPTTNKDDVKDKENDNGGTGDETEESTTKEDEDDTNLKVAWEMFELAKVIFGKKGDEQRLADTYIKLGEIGMESGHPNAIEDMLNGLKIRMECASDNERLLAETHFNIGLAYATFEQFDKAIEAFQLSKSMLQTRIEKLKLIENKKAKDEVKEMTDLLPDLDEKIQDMRDSKEAKEKRDPSSTNGEQTSLEKAATSKPVSNVSHLVKRKRKLEDVASDLLPNTKQQCKDLKTTEVESVSTEEPKK